MRIIIKLKDMQDAAEVKKLTMLLQGNIIHTFKELPYIVAEVPNVRLDVLNTETAVAAWYEDDKMFALQQELPWGIDKVDAELVHQRYNVKGSGVKVAVVDTGIDLKHSDLKVTGGISYTSPTYQDDNGHGTHVAGTIAALDNDIGVLGMAPEAQLYAVKVLDAGGSGYWSDLAKGLEWCIEHKMDIASMSLGGSTNDSLVAAAVTKAAQAGILLIAAAGNSGNSSGTGDSVEYPAKYSEVISVAATDKNNARASFSSTGPKIEVAAPGVDVKSTYLGNTYKLLSGTSMATPHVSGLAALIKSANPTLTAADLKRQLLETVTDLGTPGKDNWFGNGLINALAAVVPPGPDVFPPNLTLETPTPNTVLTGIVKLNVLANDLSGIDYIKLYFDNALLATWQTAPYSYNLDVSSIPVGNHTIKLEAADKLGNAQTLEQAFVVGPTVTITEPKANAVVRDQVTIKANVSPNCTLAKAELYVNDVLKASCVPVNYNCSFVWDANEVTNSGSSAHQLKIVAYTDQNIQGSTSVSVLVRNPVLAVTTPEANAVINTDLLQLACHTTAETSIEQVIWLVDDKPIETISSPPYNFNYNTSQLAPGNHTCHAEVVTSTSQRSISDKITFKKPAIATFITPLDGQLIKGKYDVKVKFSAPVKSAELKANNKSLGVKSVYGVGPITWSFNTASFADLTAVALKLTTTTINDSVPVNARITVTVDNFTDLSSPQVTILAPRDGYYVDQPEITIQADAKDENGITQVEFFLDNTSIGKVTSPPFSLKLATSSLQPGHHWLVAKAIDSAGNVGESNVVQIAKPAQISLVSPANSSQVSGIVHEFVLLVEAAISGKVQLSIDGTLQHTLELDAPATGQLSIPFTWDTTQYANNTEHTITVEAFSAEDSISSKTTATVIVNNSLSPNPTVKLKASTSEGCQGPVRFTAEALDDRELERVEFFINGVLVADQVFPFEYQWNTELVSPGSYSIVAKAYDTEGNEGISNVINLPLAHKVRFVAPLPNTPLSGHYSSFILSIPHPFKGEAKLFIDGQLKTTHLVQESTTGSLTLPFEWDTTTYTGLSQHDIQVVLEDQALQLSSGAIVTVIVDNRSDPIPPSICLNASAYAIAPGDPLNLTIDATDNSTLTKVDLYQAETLIASLDKAPYAFPLDTAELTTGKYSFAAIAYDQAGNTAESNTLIIGVAAPATISVPAPEQNLSGVIQNFVTDFQETISGFVFLYIDDNKVASQPVSASNGTVVIEHLWDTTKTSNGPHQIRVRAYTEKDNVCTEAKITVYVQN